MNRGVALNITNFRNLIGLTHRLSCLADFSAKGLSKGSYKGIWGLYKPFKG